MSAKALCVEEEEEEKIYSTILQVNKITALYRPVLLH